MGVFLSVSKILDEIYRHLEIQIALLNPKNLLPTDFYVRAIFPKWNVRELLLLDRDLQGYTRSRRVYNT